MLTRSQFDCADHQSQFNQVREIWVGGFRNSVTKNFIFSVFSKIGRIDKLNFCSKKNNQSFCFIKFFETIDAENSKSSIEALKNEFNSNIKIAMSDFLKRCESNERRNRGRPSGNQSPLEQTPDRVPILQGNRLFPARTRLLPRRVPPVREDRGHSVPAQPTERTQVVHPRPNGNGRAGHAHQGPLHSLRTRTRAEEQVGRDFPGNQHFDGASRGWKCVQHHQAKHLQVSRKKSAAGQWQQ